jgi:hypothetical protein
VNGVLLAESAVLVHLKSVRVVLFVLHCVVVTLFALCAGQGNFYSHFSAPPVKRIDFCLPQGKSCVLFFGHKKIDPFRGMSIVAQPKPIRQALFACYIGFLAISRFLDGL